MRPISLVDRVRRSIVEAPREFRIVGMLAIVAVAAWMLVLVVAKIGYPQVHELDLRILSWMRRADDPSKPVGPPWLLASAIEITALGSATVLLVLILSVAGYLWLEQRYGILGLVLVSTFGAMAINSWLKVLFDRPRPSVVPHLVMVSSPSFPSGHSLVSAVVYMTLGVLLTRVTTDRRAKRYLVFLAAAITFLIGLSRMYLGVHYPTDVLAGWAVGLLWALACGLVARELQRRRIVRPEPVTIDEAKQATRANVDQRVARSTSTT